MIYSELMAISPTKSRTRYSIPQADDEAIRILAMWISVVAEASILTGDFGLWALSLHEFDPADVPFSAFEWHDLKSVERVPTGGPALSRSGRFFISGSVNGQNNPSLYNYVFQRGFEYAGDLFAYTHKDGAAGASLSCAITFEYETFKLSPARRNWLHKNIG